MRSLSDIGVKHLLLIFIAFTLSFGAAEVRAQSRGDLEKKRTKLMNEISFTNKLLKDTKEDKIASINHLVTLKKQISIREELIKTIGSEVRLLTEHIDEKKAIIDALEADISNLKDEYASIIVAAYRTRSSYNKLVFLFSSNDFNSLYNRYKYLERYREFRDTQVWLIIKTKDDLNNKLADLHDKKDEKVSLLSGLKMQRSEIKADLSDESKIVSSLEKKEDKIKKDLKRKKNKAAQLKKAIEDLIKKELEAAKIGRSGAKLSAEFENNKGKLPWPVDQGIVVATFGEHPHPVFERVKTFNNGIDIKTTKDSKVLAVFNGIVVSVIYNPGFHKAVLMQHGGYFTVYSGLGEVVVKPNQKITTGEFIGTVFHDENANLSEVHIEIWKGTTILNPQLWLYKK